MTALPDTTLIQHRNLRDASRPRSRRAFRRGGEGLPSAVLRGSLQDGMVVCLAMLPEEPERFESAAVAWHRRWCAEVGALGFSESRAVLSALEALGGPDPDAAARALSATCRSHGLDEVASVFDAWLQRRPGSVVGTLPVQPAPEDPAAA